MVFEWHHLLELFLMHKHRFFDMLFERSVYMMSGAVWWFARLPFSTTFKVPKRDPKVQRRSMISKDSSTNVYVVIGGVDTNWSECERNKKFLSIILTKTTKVLGFLSWTPNRFSGLWQIRSRSFQLWKNQPEPTPISLKWIASNENYGKLSINLIQINLVVSWEKKREARQASHLPNKKNMVFVAQKQWIEQVTNNKATHRR